MGKRRRMSDSDGATPSSTNEECNVMFVDTSLDTHLAMPVSSSETVSDFKKKMVLEHVQCFPEIGDIEIHSLKVKRRGIFYHLPDDMLLLSASRGVKGNCFLSANVSASSEHCIDKKSLEHGTNDELKMGMRNIADDNHRNLSSDINILPTFETSLPVAETRNLLSPTSSQKSLENRIEGDCFAKKHKMRLSEGVCSTPHFEDNSTKFHESRKDSLLSEIVGRENFIADISKEAPQGILELQQQGKSAMCESAADISGVRNDQPDMGSRVDFEGTHVPSVTEKSTLVCVFDPPRLLPSNEWTDNTLMMSAISDKCQTELEKNIQTGKMENVAVIDPNNSDRFISGASKNKKRAKTTSRKIQDTLDTEEHATRKGGNTEEKVAHAAANNLESTLNSQVIFADDKLEKDAILESATVEDCIASKSKNRFDLKFPTGHPKSVIMGELSYSGLMDSSGAPDDAKSSGHKKRKRKAKNSAAEIVNISQLEHETGEDKSIEGTSALASVENNNSGKTLISKIRVPPDETKGFSTDFTAQKSDNEFDENIPTENMDLVTVTEPNLLARATDASGTEADVRSDVTKKKIKTKRTAKILDTSVLEHETQKDESNYGSVAPTISENANLENSISGKMKEDNLLENVAPENFISSKCENELVRAVECSKGFFDSDAKSDVSKKKKTKKTAVEIPNTSVMEHETLKGESIDGSVAHTTSEKAKLEYPTSEKLKEDNLLNHVAPDTFIASKSENELVHAVECPKGFFGYEAKSDVSKKKNKKTKRTAAKVQDTSVMEHEIQKGESIDGNLMPTTSEKANLENLTSEKVKGDNLLEHVSPDNFRSSKFENELVHDIECPKGFFNSDAKSDVCKKKKKPKKAAENLQDTSVMVHEIKKGDSIDGSVASSVSEKTNLDSTTSEKIKEVAPETFMSSKSENERVHAIQYPKDVTVKEMDMADSTSNVSIKKQKRSRKAAAQVQDPTYVEQETGKGKIVEHHNEINKLKNDEEIVLPLSHDQDMMLRSYSKVSKEETFSMKLSEADGTKTERMSFKQSKKNKGGKKSGDTDSKKSGMLQIDGVGASSDHIQAQTEGGESMVHHKETKLQLRSLDISNCNAVEKAQEANGIGEVSVPIQTKQNSDVVTEQTQIQKKNQTSTVSCASIPLTEKDSQVFEVDQAENNGLNATNNSKKVKSKRKKRERTESEVQENLMVPIKDQKNRELLTTVDDSVFVLSEQEASHIQLDKNKEKYEVTHGAAVSTDDAARCSESGGQGIDFKQYFVPSKLQDKFASGNKIKSNSKEGMQTATKVKKHGSGSASPSSELQVAPGNKKSKNGSHLRTNVVKGQADIPLDSESTSRSLGVPENKVEDSNPKDIWESNTVPEHEAIVSASSSLKKQNTSLAKSNLKTSERLIKMVGNKKLGVGLEVNKKTGVKSLEKMKLITKSGLTFQGNGSASSDTNEMVMKTPEKKKLLDNPIFQDSSSESSGCENGEVDLDARAFSSSDSSSLSGSASDRDDDLSVDSTRSGPGDTNGKSAGRKSISKLDLSAAKDMSMGTIIRSSLRFKKDKLIASQESQEYETQALEFVPESQP